jgi:hypothetical protein
MFKYQKYLIKASDHFEASNFPGIDENLHLIVSELKGKPQNFKIEMLLSFLKGHSIKAEYVNTNPQLAELIGSKILSFKNLEALFESSQNNSVFRRELELYVKDWLENAGKNSTNN